MTENENVTKAAGVVGGATLLSRIFGFIRDVVTASFFGAGYITDAFFVAFRIPNLLRRLFAEGSLTVSFIPVFTDFLQNRGKKEAFLMARAGLKLLTLILIFVTLAGIIGAPILVKLIAPGFLDEPGKYALTVELTRFMFPFILLVSILAFAMGVLNSLGHFFAPALAPVLLNLSMIVCMFVLVPVLHSPIYGLAWGVLIGGVLQLIFQVPFLIKREFYFWEKSGIFHPGLKRVGILMLPAVLGSAVYQINIFVGTLLASLLPEGSVSYLYYADRLVQFPLGIFAIAASTAVLPSLARQAADGDMASFRDTFSYAMRFISFITIPAMLGLIILREPVVALLFQRGAFDYESTRLTAVALLYYGVGLWGFSAIRVAVSGFYALQDTKTPVVAAIISIAVNIGLCLILMGPLAHGGLALATSLSSMVNLVILLLALRKKIGGIGLAQIGFSIIKTTLNALIMSAVVWCGFFLIFAKLGNSFFILASGVTVCISAGIAVYFGLSKIMKSRELETVLQMIKRKA